MNKKQLDEVIKRMVDRKLMKEESPFGHPGSQSPNPILKTYVAKKKQLMDAVREYAEVASQMAATSKNVGQREILDSILKEIKSTFLAGF